MANEIIIPDFTKNDYLMSTKPFEWLNQFNNNKLKMKQIMIMMSEKAGAVGVKNFVTLFQCYLETLKSKSDIISNNVTDFEGQPMQLDCGDWYADDFGVTSTDKFGFEIVACNHPIMPIQRMIDIDSGTEKLKLIYKKGGVWRNITVDKSTLSSNNSIIQLSAYGIAVNSENAKYLVRYLTDIEHLNYDRIPEIHVVTRLGWIDDYGFSPYGDNLIFAGDISYKHFFESVSEKGTFDKWLEIVKDVRKNGSIASKIILASSFASVLLKPLGLLPFFIHLWGTTETGKTVALMFAASVWANPKLGEYIHSFNSTAVAQELSATFVNSMPLILDELQIKKEKKNFDNIIYELTEGIGKNRGAKGGGLQKIGTWQNCIITNGEMPINSINSGGGAMNRVIEIECNSEMLFENPVEVAETLKKNYGFAGKFFIDELQKDSNIEYARELQKDFASQIQKNDITDKQSISASAILVADKLIEEWIFKDGQTVSVEDVSQFLCTRKEVSAEERAYSYLFETIAMNYNKFDDDNEKDIIWGTKDDTFFYIINTQFDNIMLNGGYNSKAFLSWLRKNDKIHINNSGKSTPPKRIKGNLVRCVWLKRGEIEGFKEALDDIEMPF